MRYLCRYTIIYNWKASAGLFPKCFRLFLLGKETYYTFRRRFDVHAYRYCLIYVVPNKFKCEIQTAFYLQVLSLNCPDNRLRHYWTQIQEIMRRQKKITSSLSVLNTKLLKSKVKRIK